MDTLSNTVAAIDSEQQTATLFVALELGQATWVVALHSPIADKISIYRIEGGDTDQLMALIEKKRVQAARRPAPWTGARSSPAAEARVISPRRAASSSCTISP